MFWLVFKASGDFLKVKESAVQEGKVQQHSRAGARSHVAKGLPTDAESCQKRRGGEKKRRRRKGTVRERERRRRTRQRVWADFVCTCSGHTRDRRASELRRARPCHLASKWSSRIYPGFVKVPPLHEIYVQKARAEERKPLKTVSPAFSFSTHPPIFSNVPL